MVGGFGVLIGGCYVCIPELYSPTVSKNWYLLLLGVSTIGGVVSGIWIVDATKRSFALATKRIRHQQRLCISCEYDLTGNVSGVCPECGTAIATPQRDSIRGWIIVRRYAAIAAICIVMIGLLFGGLNWYWWSVLGQYEMAYADGVWFTEALQFYAVEHDGRLPSDFQDLVSEGYLRKDADGCWELQSRKVPMPEGYEHTMRSGVRVCHPERFDVAWGINALEMEIQEDGRLPSLDRRLVEPGDVSPPDLVQWPCTDMNHRLAALLRTLNTGSTVTSTRPGLDP
jgi:hypothetical protein